MPLEQTLEINLDYSPQPKQANFHCSEAKYRLYIGAWRAGKTYAGCMEALKKSMLYPNNCGVIGRKDFTDLRETTLRTFLEICPQDFIANYNKTEHLVTCVNGSRIYFRELKDGTGLGSLNLGWFYMDEAEEVDEAIFDRLKGRLSLRNVGVPCGWLTSNPPNEAHWIYKQFEETEDSEFYTIHASTYENKRYLPDGYIEDLEKLPTAWRKKYLEGQYGFTPDGTPYYRGYSELVHRANLEWSPNLPLYCGWDSGRRHPAFVVTQWDGKMWKILAEILGSNIGIEAFVDTQVIPLLNSRFPNANIKHCAGPEFLQVNDKSDFTSYQILQAKKIQLYIKHSEYSLRKQVMERMINTITDGVPILQVDTTCKMINDGFLGGYRYPKKTEGQAYNPKDELPFKDGFYEHCVSGETNIRTLDGWHKIQDLVGKEFITYSYDSFNKRLIPASAHSCRKTQVNVELWKLSFDNGELIATPTHLIMMRDGSYKQLRDLKQGDELMPFYEKQRSSQGHKMLHLNDGSIVDEHRYIYNWFNGNLRQDYHIHHIDANPENNYPQNLRQILAKRHMAEVYMRMRRDGKITNGSTNPWTRESREKMSRYMKLKHQESRKDKLCVICKKPFYGIPRQLYCSKRCLWKSKHIKDKLQLTANINHKVIYADFYGYGDTYNFEVDIYHNFVANGIMIHNCMNALEYVAIQLFRPIGETTKPKLAKAVDYGERQPPKRHEAQSLSSWSK